MRTRSFDTLVITLGLGLTVGQLGCKGDDEGESDSAADAESSGSSTESGSTTATGMETESSSASTTSDTDCIPGELGCTCNGGLCLGDLVCENDICTDPNCIPGELACECNMGLCLGDLVCVDGVCLEDGGTTSETSMGTTTDTGSTTTDTGMDCPNPNEMLCDGVCVDVVSNPDHCGGCGVVCEVSMDMTVGGCEDSQCLPYWSETCFQQNDGFTTCDQVCQAEGKACVEDGCGGYTWIQADSTICVTGNTNALHSGVACGGGIVWQAGFAKCCCTP